MLANFVKKNSYHDSVFLMTVAQKVRELEGIEEVACVMGTPENLAIVDRSGMLDDVGRAAGPNDLLIAVRGKTRDALAAAELEVERLLETTHPAATDSQDAVVPRTVGMALRANPQANLAVISVPGRYAAGEADRALDAGLHVFLFSDNVSVEDEIRLKQKAIEKGLLLMGPDCGTAILGGAAVGFANVVRRGSIGIVAAAGTGLQEVSVLVHQGGGGVSHGIGTGGRDLSAAVAGLTTKQAIKLLEADKETEVLVVVSKPPAPVVAREVVDLLERGSKASVVNFVGATRPSQVGRIRFASTLEDAALEALRLAGVGSQREEGESAPLALDALAGRLPSPPPPRRLIRGLFSGGTLSYEAQLILNESLEAVWSNAPLSPEWKLSDSSRSVGHCVVDLGADEFTVGRPHPMIDYTLRNERILKEIEDPETGILLLDVVLGYGSHPDPAAELAGPLRAAREERILVLVHLCGTDEDPQGFSRQKAALEGLGAVVLRSNAAAARLAARLARRAVGVGT